MDTSLFPAKFQSDLLTALSDNADLDELTDGVLIHADNFQALNLLQARYQEQVKCIYIDPPYNTEDDRIKGKFLYKDGFPRASWLTLLASRLETSRNLMKENANIFMSINDVEQSYLKVLCDSIFNEKNFIANYKWNKTSTPPALSDKVRSKYEYVLCYEKAKSKIKYNGGIVSGGDMPLLNEGNTVNRITFPKHSMKFNISGEFKAGQYDRVYLHNDIVVEDGYADKDIILESCFKWLQSTVDEEIAQNTTFIIKTEKFAVRYAREGERVKRPSDVLSKTECEIGTNEDGAKELSNLFNNKKFDYPKPSSLISYLSNFIVENNKDLILDYFAGSGTTAHAVINLNREDQGRRKYILVEQGEYFDTVLKPRVQKVVYARNWKDGKPVADEQGSLNGVSQLVKVLKLESYEDTLNNLTLKGQTSLFRLPENAQEDYLLRYMLDTESKDSLLKTDHFAKPFDYQLNIRTDSAGAYQTQIVDLVETFNYLLGLRVQAVDYSPFEKYGYLKIYGELSPFKANGKGKRCLIIWRDCERLDNDVLIKRLKKDGINPQDSQFDVVYLNGDHTLAAQWVGEFGDKSLNLRPIEPEFLRLMFAEA